MKKILFTLWALSLCLAGTAKSTSGDEGKITNDRFWYTSSGEPIFSQGGGIFKFRDTQTGLEHYYWYGVHYQAADDYVRHPEVNKHDATFTAVTCYVSDDLVNWKFMNNVLTADEVNRHQQSRWVGRLGVAYIPELKKFAMLTQYNGKVLVATADSPTGDFKWYRLIDMKGIIGTSNTGDQTVFTDDDGISYLIYSYGKGRNKIYVSEIGVKDGVIGLMDCRQVYQGKGREGNCMFKYKGKYYMCASNLYGWDASLAYYLVSDNIRGPYMPTNDMKIMRGCERDYAHITQTGFFYTIKGSKQETVVYCGDRWTDFAGNGYGFNQWCPLSFVDNEPFFNSLSDWHLNAKTGEWTVGKDNNYAINGSFEADRRLIPNPIKPAQDFLLGWNTVVVKGNPVAIGAPHSPVLNQENSQNDRMVVTGEKCMNISDTIDFCRKICQTIESTPFVRLPTSLYRLSAKVKCSTGFRQLRMYATTTDSTYCQDISDRDTTWHEIVLNDIPVKNGKVEIGFTADARGGAWCHIDDVTLRIKHDE